MADTVAATKFSLCNERSLSRRDLDVLLNGDYQNSFDAQDYFSDTSNNHVFEVICGIGSFKLDLPDEELSEIIDVS